MTKQRIFIKRIEIIDFESHKHTVLDGFSKGFNTIIGNSDIGKCLSGDTVITDFDGTQRTILDMFEQGSWKIPSLKDGKFIFRNGTAIQANGDRKLFKISTLKGKEIKATENHKFLTEKGWTELKDLKEGDWIAIAKKMPIFGNNKLPEGDARMIGYLLGDGSTIKGVSFTNEEEEVLEDWIRLVKLQGDHNFTRVKAGNAYTIKVSKPLSFKNRSIGSCGIWNFCKKYDLCGKKNINKKIPDIIFNSCKNDIRDVLLGLLITDGHVCKNIHSDSYEISFSTVSKILAVQINHLLTRFGIVSTLREKKTSWTHKGIKKHGKSFSIDIHGKEFFNLFASEIGSSFTGKKSKTIQEGIDVYKKNDILICRYDGVPRTNDIIKLIQDEISKCPKTTETIKKEIGMAPTSSLIGNDVNQTFGIVFLKRLAESLNSDKIKEISNSDLYYDRIKSISYHGIEPTFDIEVEDTHTFFANDIYTHNTSILRALNLCAYNKFNPESVRLGAKFCDVTVTTNIGSVNVKRGQGVNIWTVQKDGCEPKVFDKVGKNEVAEACDILGMKTVQFGDVSIPVNIMNQLESHFLIAAVGDEKANGSMRAQIIDEICGLSGAEELIKNIGLDLYRVTRKINEDEEKIKDLKSRLNSESDIKNDELLLGELDQLQENINVCEGNKDFITGVISEHRDLVEKLSKTEDRIKELPHMEDIDEMIRKVSGTLIKMSSVNRILSEFKKIKNDLSANNKKQKELPDMVEMTDEWKEWLKKLDNCQKIKEEYTNCKNRLKNLNIKISELEDVDVSPAIQDLSILKACKEILSVYMLSLDRENKLKIEIDLKEARLLNVENKIKEVYATIDICPITNKPISESCSLSTLKGTI